jgi:hypothetical protein
MHAAGFGPGKNKSLAHDPQQQTGRASNQIGKLESRKISSAKRKRIKYSRTEVRDTRNGNQDPVLTKRRPKRACLRDRAAAVTKISRVNAECERTWPAYFALSGNRSGQRPSLRGGGRIESRTPEKLRSAGAAACDRNRRAHEESQRYRRQ